MPSIKTGLLSLLLLFPAFVAAKTGNDLQGECSVALKLFNNETVSAQEDFIKIGNCIGFVTGVMQTAELGKASPPSRPSKDKDKDPEPVSTFCAPPDLSVEKVVRMSLNRLKTKPEELDLDAAAVVLRALNEGFPPSTCIVGGPPGKQAEGLHWPEPPKKVHMRVRVVAVALSEPRSSVFSSHEVLVAETEIGDEEWSLIKLVFSHLPYQPRLSETGFDYSLVHELQAWRNTDCDETVSELQTRSLPQRHQPLIYARNVPRNDLDRRRIPLPCYEAKADDYLRSTMEPVPPPPKPRPVLQARPTGTPPPPEPNPTPTPATSGPVLKTRPTPE